MAETTTSSVSSRVVRSGTLLRTIGFTGVLFFGVHCISLSSSGLLPFSTVAGLWPGSNVAGVLTIAMVFCIFHAYTFAVIGTAVPCSGADYVLSSRLLPPWLAFATSWTLVIFSALVAGSLIALIPQSTLPSFLQSMGILFDNQNYLDLAVQASQPQGIILVGTVCTVLAFVITILSPRDIFRILLVGFILGLVAWAIIYFVLATAPANAFPKAWDTFMGKGSYNARIDLARTLGMKINPNPQTMTLAGLLMGFWIFYGYFIPTYFAGEVEKPGRNLLRGSLLALVLTWAVFLGSTFLLGRLVPAEWLAAESFLRLRGYSELTMPWITFYTVILRPSFPLVLFVAFAWIFTLINLVQTYFFYTSRILLAWTSDRLIPEVVGYVHPQLRSPLVAVLIVAIIAEFGVIDAAQGGALSSQLNFVFFAVCAQLVPVLSITLFPFLKKEWFIQSDRFVMRKIGVVPVITIVGVITLVYLIWLIISSFLFPVVAGPIRAGTIIILASLFGSGLVWYFLRLHHLRTQGLDVRQLFTELPER